MIDISYQTIIETLIDKIKTYDISEEFSSQLSEKTDIVSSEEIDSLDTMDYIFFLEETYGITIEDEEIQENGLLIIGETARFIISKKPE
jgi:acyl carrier protein